MTNRITPAQREAIVLRAIAERDALLTPPPAPTAAEQAQPVMVVPKSIYRAFHGKEQEAWLHGFRTAFERYAATPVPEQAQPAGVTDEQIDSLIAGIRHPGTTQEGARLHLRAFLATAARAQEGEKP